MHALRILELYVPLRLQLQNRLVSFVAASSTLPVNAKLMGPYKQNVNTASSEAEHHNANK